MQGDGDDESGDEAAPCTTLEARRQAQAAGDHELQQSFRSASAQLLMKYGMAPTGKTAEELGEDSDEDSGEGPDGGVDEGEGSEEEDAAGDFGSDDEEVGDEFEASLDGEASHASGSSHAKTGGSLDHEAIDVRKAAGKGGAKMFAVGSEVADRLMDVPYTIKVQYPLSWCQPCPPAVSSEQML